ncbi:MAG TPA: hypothetical protein VIC56_02480 [Gemmatimonadota bacterium]|jgi:hypothetical protein
MDLHLALLLLAPCAGAGPLAAQDRWQLTLEDGRYEYELQPVALRGDSLVIEQRGRTLALALADIHELREVRPVIRPSVPGRGTIAELTGAADRVFVLGYLTPDDRRRVVQEILGERARLARGHAAGSTTQPAGTPTEWGP